MNRPLLLLHSPLVGPSTWSRLAAVADGRGLDVVAPDLTGFVERHRPRWPAFVEAAVAAAAGLDDVIVVGHSGCGALLPSIARRLGDRVAALVFVDAINPPTAGRWSIRPELASLLDAQSADGLLAPWLDWWPAAVIESLLPSPRDRALISGDMPSVPRDTYDDPVPLPDRWTDGPCAYLRLSEAYDDDRDRAAELGWPTSTVDGTHLGIVTEPDGTLDAILDLVARLPGGP